MKNKNTLSVTALVTFGSALASGAAHAASISDDMKAATPNQINRASSQLVAERWLRVPPMCKDRSFPFVPTETADRNVGKTMQAILASFDAAVEMVG